MGRKLYVGNLTYGVTDSDLQANSRPETGNMRFGCEAYFYLHSDTLFSYFLEKGPFSFRALFPGSSPAIRC